MQKQRKNLVIGIGGGTGSGKTTIADRILERVGTTDVTVIKQDAYYKSRDDLSVEEREKINFDHPDAFDTELLIDQLSKLKNGHPVQAPIYDFKIHLRKKETITELPKKIILLEGILIYENERLRKLMDIKIFVDTDADIRILRRITRDMRERGRTFQSVYDQYIKTVRPMHIEFVEPSKKYADIIIPEGGFNDIAIDMVVSKIKSILSE